MRKTFPVAGRLVAKIERMLHAVIRCWYRHAIMRVLETELRPCLLCGGGVFTLLHDRDKYGLQIATVRCQCGFVMENPMPTPRFIERYYRSHLYRGIESGWLWPGASHFRKTAVVAARNVRYVLHLRQRGLFKTAEPVILDYGCAEGMFLHLLKKAWPGVDVQGVEPGSRFLGSASTDLVIHPSLDAVPRRTFDAITLWHVFEHIGDPDRLLASLHERISDHGFLILEVPDVQKYGSRMDAISLGHLYHYSRETLCRVMQRNGFNLVEVNDSFLQIPSYGMKMIFTPVSQKAPAASQ